MINLFGTNLPEPKYKQDDEVFVYVNPIHLVDPTQIPVLECDVDSIKYIVNSNYGTPEIKIEYELMSGLDTIFRSEEEIFGTKEDALLASIKDVENMENKAHRKAAEMSQLVRDIRGLLQTVNEPND